MPHQAGANGPVFRYEFEQFNLSSSKGLEKTKKSNLTICHLYMAIFYVKVKFEGLVLSKEVTFNLAYKKTG